MSCRRAVAEPETPGVRVRTNRRDAVEIARLLRSGDLGGVWVPSVEDEAIRDIWRARDAARATLKDAKLRVNSFVLRLGPDSSSLKGQNQLGRQSNPPLTPEVISTLRFSRPPTGAPHAHANGVAAEWGGCNDLSARRPFARQPDGSSRTASAF